jgi:Silicon transporter
MITGMKESPGMAFRNVYSTLLLIFCTIIVVTVIVDGNTKLSAIMHPSIVVIILWVSIIWLSMVEGSQAALVGLPPVQLSLYEESHPNTHRIMKVVNKGDNLDRYLMGRQFLVLALVFVENLCGKLYIYNNILQHNLLSCSEPSDPSHV